MSIFMSHGINIIMHKIITLYVTFLPSLVQNCPALLKNCPALLKKCPRAWLRHDLLLLRHRLLVNKWERALKYSGPKCRFERRIWHICKVNLGVSCYNQDEDLVHQCLSYKFALGLRLWRIWTLNSVSGSNSPKPSSSGKFITQTWCPRS